MKTLISGLLMMALQATNNVYADSQGQEYGSLGPSKSDNSEIKLGFAHTAFSVENFEESIDWYRQKLGFEVLEYATVKDGIRAAQLVNGGLHVELFESINPGELTSADISTPGIKHLAFLVKDVDATAEELRARGVHVEQVFHLNGDVVADFFFVQDNSGNTLEFIQPLRGDPEF